MNLELFQDAIRDPTPEAASNIMSNITPDLISDIMPSIINSSQESAVLAENTLDQILTVVETKILGENVDFIIDNFGYRIIDMLTGDIMLSIFERVARMMVGS